MESNFSPMQHTNHPLHHSPLPISTVDQMISSLSAYSMLTQADWETGGKFGVRKRRKNNLDEDRRKIVAWLAVLGERRKDDGQKISNSHQWRVR